MSPLEREQLSEFADHVAGLKHQLRVYEAKIKELAGDMEAAHNANHALSGHIEYLSGKVERLELETADAKAAAMAAEAMADKMARSRYWPAETVEAIANQANMKDPRGWDIDRELREATGEEAWNPDDTGVRRRIAKLQAAQMATDLPEDCSCSTSTESDCEPLFPRGKAPKLAGEP